MMSIWVESSWLKISVQVRGEEHKGYKLASHEVAGRNLERTYYEVTGTEKYKTKVHRQSVVEKFREKHKWRHVCVL